MGGIADYSGALVLELPLARATWAAVQRQSDPRCEIMTRRDDTWHTFAMPVSSLVDGELRDGDQLGKWFAERGGDRWPSYIVGVVQRCLTRAAIGGDAGGFRILVESTVPEGKGVASSAALEVSVMSAMTAACGDDIAPTELATECQWVENHVVGAPCGIMDQMTSACGRQQRVLRLRCQPGTIEGHVDVPDGYRFYGIDSGVRHAVSGDDYSTVRTGAFMGYRIIAELEGLRIEQHGTCVRIDDPRWHGYLANLTPDEFSEYEPRLPEILTGDAFLAHYGGITDPVTRVRSDVRYRVRQATAHPIHEQRRVEAFAHLLSELENSDGAEQLGQLMYASHASYSACGLGSNGTDRLVEMVAELGSKQGLFGAKITGGGSGGTVAILGTDRAGSLVSEIARRYQHETGRRAEVFDESGPGAAETGVLVIAR
jgi:L-arabinokinase